MLGLVVNSAYAGVAVGPTNIASQGIVTVVTPAMNCTELLSPQKF
jgi:hypothetical protein